MLSLGKVSTGSAAASYYETADDYYHQDRSPSQWQGDGAARLGLAGEVDAEIFRAALDGKLPDGAQLHNAAEGRRGGTDFTFSAPKSVSMQALIGNDNRLIDAHEKAVARTLAYAENLAAYRITEAGITKTESSHNLLIAAFRHDLSRSQDPNLHTHAVVINATQRPDGEWRALEQGDFYRQQKLMGALYRAELALEVQEMGYRVQLTHADGRFELSHLTDTQIEAFSQRSQAIEAALAAKGLTRDEASARTKEVATLATRQQKGEIDRQALRAEWHAKSHALGVNYCTDLQPVTANREQAVGDAVSYAIAHNAERQAVISEIQLVRTALERGTGQTDLSHIRLEIERQVLSGVLIREGCQYTTQEAQNREREMLAMADRGRSMVSPILDTEHAEQHLAKTALNHGQRAAAKLMVTTSDRVVAIQGAAGTGKTTMLREARDLAESVGYEPLGLAPSAAAARELAGSGIPSQTLASFLTTNKTALHDRSVVVLDEAGMVSAKDMQQLLKNIEAANARLVLVGDIQQLKAVEAGRPFAQLQEAGVTRVSMGEVQRQQDAQLKRAVELAAKGDVGRSLAVLHRQVHEIDNNTERYQRIAQDYVAQAPTPRTQSLIVAGTNVARRAINEQVRLALGLTGKGMTVNTLKRLDLTEVQSKMSHSYQRGDVIEAQKRYDSLNLAKGDLARVVDVAPGRITLELANGQHADWRPAVQTNMSAYRAEQLELAIGDQIRMTANDHGRELVNSERACVTAINPERQAITLQTTSGRAIELDSSRALHLDHGYCSTVHAAQGQTVDKVLIEADTRSVLANESQYYVAISRARSEAVIYTDDKSSLAFAMGREDFKSAALDIGQDVPANNHSNFEHSHIQNQGYSL